MIGIVIGLLTIAGLGSILVSSLIALWKHPPVINVTFNIPDQVNLSIELAAPDLQTPSEFTLAIPTEFKITQQKQPAFIETDSVTEHPIPENILDYINLESDNWAQEGRKRRVRALYNDSNDWNYAFRQLQIEDGINE